MAKVLSDPALVSRVMLAAVGASGCEARQLVRGAAVCRAWLVGAVPAMRAYALSAEAAEREATAAAGDEGTSGEEEEEASDPYDNRQIVQKRLRRLMAAAASPTLSWAHDCWPPYGLEKARREEAEDAADENREAPVWAELPPWYVLWRGLHRAGEASALRNGALAGYWADGVEWFGVGGEEVEAPNPLAEEAPAADPTSDIRKALALLRRVGRASAAWRHTAHCGAVLAGWAKGEADAAKAAQLAAFGQALEARCAVTFAAERAQGEATDMYMNAGAVALPHAFELRCGAGATLRVQWHLWCCWFTSAGSEGGGDGFAFSASWRPDGAGDWRPISTYSDFGDDGGWMDPEGAWDAASAAAFQEAANIAALNTRELCALICVLGGMRPDPCRTESLTHGAGEHIARAQLIGLDRIFGAETEGLWSTQREFAPFLRLLRLKDPQDTLDALARAK